MSKHSFLRCCHWKGKQGRKRRVRRIVQAGDFSERIGWRPSLLGWRPLLLVTQKNFLVQNQFMFCGHAECVTCHLAREGQAHIAADERAHRAITSHQVFSGNLVATGRAFGYAVFLLCNLASKCLKVKEEGAVSTAFGFLPWTKPWLQGVFPPRANPRVDESSPTSPAGGP